MSCVHCKELTQRVSIRTPGELRKVITIAQQAVIDGIIEEVDAKEWHEPFSRILADGPWEDIVGHNFACKHCGQHFELTAETYHGQGGAWTTS